MLLFRGRKGNKSKNMNPLLSVIVPNYNDSKHIGQTIESVLSQNYSPIELVILDDGSVDNSLGVISKYLGDKRINLISRKENKGTVYTVNEGIANASGQYIMLFSSNDYFLPGFVPKSMEMLMKHPDVGVSCTETLELDTATGQFVKKPPSMPRLKAHVKIATSRELPKILQKSFLKLSATAAVMKTELVKAEGGLKGDLYCSCDWYLVTKIAFSTGLIFIPEPLVCWRNSPNRYTERILRDKQAAKLMYSNLLNELKRCDKEMQQRFKQAGELGCVLKFTPSEILKRPEYWLSCPYAIRRYLMRAAFKKMHKVKKLIF